MTVSNTTTESNYVGNNSTTTFATGFIFLADSHVEVRLDDVLQTDPADYSIVGSDVVFVTAPGSGVAIEIKRNTPKTQLLDMADGISVPQETLETAYDKTTLIAQENAANAADAEGRLDTLEPQVSTNTTNIATNTSNISTNTSNISTNTTNIATNTGDIATHTGQIASISAQQVTNTSDIAGHETRLTNVEALASNNNANIATNSSNIATNTSNIATNTTNISTNTTNISTNTSNISTNTTNIATNTTNISTNTTDIATNADSITQLTDRTTTLEDQITQEGERLPPSTFITTANITNFSDKATIEAALDIDAVVPASVLDGVQGAFQADSLFKNYAGGSFNAAGNGSYRVQFSLDGLIDDFDPRNVQFLCVLKTDMDSAVGGTVTPIGVDMNIEQLTATTLVNAVQTVEYDIFIDGLSPGTEYVLLCRLDDDEGTANPGAEVRRFARTGETHYQKSACNCNWESVANASPFVLMETKQAELLPDSRVIVKDQASLPENGFYRWDNGTTTLVREDVYEIHNDSFSRVREGLQKNQYWYLTSDSFDPIDYGVDDIEFFRKGTAVASGVNYPDQGLQSLAAGGQITISSLPTQQIRVDSTGGAVNLNVLSILNGGAGRRVVIIGTSDTNYPIIQFNDANGGFVGNGHAEMKRYRMLEVIFNASLNRFVELSRNF